MGLTVTGDGMNQSNVNNHWVGTRLGNCLIGDAAMSGDGVPGLFVHRSPPPPVDAGPPQLIAFGAHCTEFLLRTWASGVYDSFRMDRCHCTARTEHRLASASSMQQ